MSAENFAKLAYLPLPLLDTDEEHFQPFNIFIWSNSFRHTSASASAISHLKVLQPKKPRRLIRVKKNLSVNSEVCSVVKCQECCKPRCVHALKKLISAESALVEEVDSSKLYLWITITSIILSIL